jgi:hypothetical protein
VYTSRLFRQQFFFFQPSRADVCPESGKEREPKKDERSSTDGGKDFLRDHFGSD